MLTLNEKEQRLIERALKVLEKRATEYRANEQINSPEKARHIFQLRLATLPREEFHVAYLDNRNRIISIDCEFVGTLTHASVYPREIIRKAIQYNAAAVIFAHNHPSGAAEPSTADRRITEFLQEGLRYIEVRVLDHVIIAHSDHFSFAEKGLL